MGHVLPIGHDTVQALAVDLLAMAPPRFALAGLSMGGIVAMEVLRQAPHRIERLALLDTNPRAETAQAQTNRARQIARALSGDLAGVLRDEMKPDCLAPGPQRDHILDPRRSLPASPPRCATGRTNAPHSPASRVPLSC